MKVFFKFKLGMTFGKVLKIYLQYVQFSISFPPSLFFLSLRTCDVSTNDPLSKHGLGKRAESVPSYKRIIYQCLSYYLSLRFINK